MARGTITPRKRQDGSTVYDVRYDVPSGDGRRRQARKTLTTRKAAERFLAAQLAALDRGVVPAETRETLAEYLDRWLAEHRARIEDYTYRAYQVDVRLRLKPALGAVRLRDLTPQHVRRLVADLSATGRLRPKTINNAVTVLRVALAHAVEDGLIATNPAASGRRARVTLPPEHREMDYLRRDEIAAYLTGCTPAYRPLAELLVGTGLRIGEAVALTWGDVDWRSSAILVHRARKIGHTGSTKGDRARRVEIGPRLLELLRDLHARRLEHQLGDDVDDLVFPSSSGDYLDRSHVSRIWHHDALRRAGLRRTVRLHDLRHSAAAAWLAAGLPLVYVQRQLGHRDITTTVRCYGHLEASFLRDAAARAEAAVFASVT